MNAGVVVRSCLALTVMAGASAAGPIGALGVSGDLLLTETTRRRVSAEAVVYVTRRYGLYLGAARVSTAPWFEHGQMTGGVALRAAAARPTLDLVIHADVGIARADAPVLGGGVTTYLWPARSIPIAITVGSRAYLVVADALDPTLSLGVFLGLALAR